MISNPLKSILFNRIILLSLAGFMHLSVYAQEAKIMLSKDYAQLSWTNFVEKAEQEFNLDFYFDTERFPEFNIEMDTWPAALEFLLAKHLNPLGYHFVIDRDNHVFISKDIIKTNLSPEFFKDYYHEDAKEVITDSEKDETSYIQTKKEYVAREIIVGTKKEGYNKTKAIVSGYVKDAISKEGITGATVAISDLSLGVATDENGYFKLNLNLGKHNLIIQHLGSHEEKINVEVLSDGSFEVFLEEEAILLDEAVISAQKYNKVSGTEMGIEKLTAKSVKEIPLVMGERDIVKVALLLPGIQTVGEGSAGFNVRGSPTDQNLFYINHLPIYNTAHLSGFFSAFNSDVIDEFALYKSNIPVKYGGRLSSIFEITAKQGNKEKYTAQGGISPITGRVMAEGPINKGKSSFLVGLRSTYSDWLLKLAKNPDIKNSTANFADAVTNLTLNFGLKDQLNIFTYYSYDQMDLADKTNYEYQNIGVSLHWKHIFNKVNSFDLSAVNSNYHFSEESNELAVASYVHSNKLTHSEIKASVNLNNLIGHKVNFGINSILYNVNRGTYEPLSLESLIDQTDLGKEKGLESAMFVSDEWSITKAIILSMGLRYNWYAYLGPQDISTYLEGLPKTNINFVETLHFDKNEIIKSYGGLDWRVAANYMFNDDFSLKFSYNRQHQYIFMLSNSIAISPDYKWKLTDYNTKPIIGDQFSAGLFMNSFWGGNKFEISLEGYYKNARNVVEIKDGADLIMNEFSEQSTLQGTLDAYGIEFMIKKNSGKLNGWLNYTFSNTSVLVDSEFPENQINFGNPYPSNYDKPHSLNVVANYRFKRRLSISGNVVYSTGRPITYPTAVYYQNGFKTLHYSKRNEYRIPDYFRIDLSLSVEGNLKKKKLAHGSWTFSVYNLIGRKNAYSVYFRYEEGQINGYKLSIFGSPIVSLTYNFKLGNYAD